MVLKGSMYFSICFLFQEFTNDISPDLEWWCEMCHFATPVRVVKRWRIVTLVEAHEEYSAIEKRRKTHPDLFKNSRYDVIAVTSPKEWCSFPNCTFKFPEQSLHLEFEGTSSSLNFRSSPAAKHAFEMRRHRLRGIEWQPL